MVDFIQRVSQTMPAPTFGADGRPDASWLPTVARSNWGKLQLVIGGAGMTKVRGQRFLPLTVAYTEPFGDAEATFALPGLTEFDDPAAWGLHRMAPVRMRRKDPDGIFHTVYEGELASVGSPETPEHGLEIHCIGALYRLDLLKKSPVLLQTALDYGTIIARSFNNQRGRFALHVAEMEHVTTGIEGTETADFQPFLTGTIQDYLSEMTTDDGNQWTIKLHRPRTPRLSLKDMTTVDLTVSFGAQGVACQLWEDFTTGTTGVYASGSNGHCQWEGARFPNLVQTATPAFPLGVGATFVAGDGQTGFAAFAAFLRRGQYGTIVSDDTYDPADVDNVVQMQDRAGVTADGIVGAQTWEAAFQPGFNQGAARGAYVGTIYEKIETRRYLTNAQGARIGPNPAFDPTIPAIEDYLPLGDNVSKQLGRKTAKQLINRAHPVGITGTITLTADPAEMSRWDARAGMNVQVDNYQAGSHLLHIARVEQDWQGESVTLTVDEKGRDYLTLAQVHQRRRDLSDLTRREKFGRTRSKVFDDYGTWLCEDGAGEIPFMSQQGGFWNVQRIAAAPKGSIARVSLALGSGLTEHLLNVNLSDHPNATIPGAARGAMAIFARPVTANALANLLGDPVHYDVNNQNPWDREADTLARKGMIYAAGGPGAQIGFFPNDDPGDGTDTNLSGRFEDGGGVDFGPTGRYWLYVAIYTTTSCLVGGRIFPGAPG